MRNITTSKRESGNWQAITEVDNERYIGIHKSRHAAYSMAYRWRIKQLKIFMKRNQRSLFDATQR